MTGRRTTASFGAAAVRRIVALISADAVDSTDGASLDDIADRFEEDYPEQFAASVRWLIRGQIKAIARKEMADSRAVHSEQLPGFELPAVLTVFNSETGYRYISAARARMSDLKSDCDIRGANAIAATTEWRRRVAAYERLRATPGVTNETPLPEAVAALAVVLADSAEVA